WCRVPDHVDGHVCSRSTDETEFCGIITYAVAPDHLRRGKVMQRHRNQRSVARCHFVDVVCGSEAASAWHVRDEEGRIAGYETAEMFGCELAIERVCTRRTVPDNNSNGLASEIVRGSRTVRNKYNPGKCADDCASAPSQNPRLRSHCLPPRGTGSSVLGR